MATIGKLVKLGTHSYGENVMSEGFWRIGARGFRYRGILLQGFLSQVGFVAGGFDWIPISGVLRILERGWTEPLHFYNSNVMLVLQ